MSQLTSKETCKKKKTYWSYATATRAKKRRNKAAGYNHLRAYKCDNCELWHLITELKEAPKEQQEEDGDGRNAH